MTSFFDFCGILLFLAGAGLYFHRLQHEKPPLLPYIVIALACAFGNWAGDEFSPMTGTVLLISAGFLIVHMASQPYPEKPEEPKA